MVVLMAKVVLLCGTLWTACGDREAGAVERADTHILKELNDIADNIFSNGNVNLGFEGHYLSESKDVYGARTHKRGFDSIGHNTHFGGTVRTIGRAPAGNDENPVFTFESLFPVLARHLRSRTN